jgi:Protein of unknown function (DUF1173)
MQGAAYEVSGRRFGLNAPGFAEAIAEAHATHQQPRCLCTEGGVAMYVARLAGESGGYIVKRMPDSGSLHAPDCTSYEPPADASGLAEVLGSAIVEDANTGETRLRLDFALNRMPGRSGVPPTSGEASQAASSGTRLSLRGLLHYLWHQAELTRWHPGFTGKRSWAMVRRHLLQAAAHKRVGGEALGARLYVPEPFAVEERDAINARRHAQWQHALASSGHQQPLMLLIGEVKEIVPARFGFKAIVKHLPDQAFAIDEPLYRRLARCFANELALWGANEDLHLVMIATFALRLSGIPAIHELCLMPATRQWLPVEDGFEKQLIERLVSEGRSFVKGLRYNAHRSSAVISATLTDCGSPPAQLWLHREGPAGERVAPASVTAASKGQPGEWHWCPQQEAMPSLPAKPQPSRQRDEVA